MRKDKTVDGLIRGVPMDGLPYPHPEAPPGFDQVATFLHVTAVGVLVVGVTVALIAGLVARRRTCSRATSFMMAVGVAGAVVGGIGVIAMSLLS